MRWNKVHHFHIVSLPIFILCMLCFMGCQNTHSENNNQTDTIAAENVSQSNESASYSEETPNTDESEEIQEMKNNETTKPMIALTFDDGPNLDTTPLILDLLEEYDVKASFFLIGNNVNMSTKKVVERAHELGCDIQNHSMTHSDMTKQSTEEIVKEISTLSNMITNITGEEPLFFRPPYIAVNDTMYETIDLTFICGLGCDDWNSSVTTDERIESVLNQAQDGAIILLHDSSGNTQTVDALKTIIPSLLNDGYELVTVTELFEAKGIEISAQDTNLYSVLP